MEEGGNGPRDQRRKRALIIVFSYHHRNTEKIARAMAQVLDAQVRTPREVSPEELEGYDIVGFGSGIYDAKHHASLLDLADRLPKVPGKEAFLFSTCGVPEVGMSRELARRNHLTLRERLEPKGYRIIDEFSCVGWNTNSFLRLFGGINKGRPDAQDLKRAQEFARKLRQSL
jgi:flavodoxin